MRLCVRKMSRRLRTPRPPKTASTCCFCGFSEDNEVEYGKLYTHKGIVTHYFCLLLSANMQQNGKDNQGILGFMPSDIQKELRRGKRLACFYCRKVGATLGCCNSRCKRVFHLPCGLQAGSLHQFFDEFRSYCVTHRINQEIDEHIKEEAAAAGTVTCYICYEEVNPQNTIRTLWAPCCRKNAWFHRKCVQRLALSAGYFFKCPLCNNNQEFQKAMLEHGIFIPNQDASWELVPNAYQELLHRHNSCDAAECLCPKGRSHTSLNTKWELVLCRLCGSQGVHKACGDLKWVNSHWECNECVDMLHKSDEAAPPGDNQIKEVSQEIADDESSDSDISVGQNPLPFTITERPKSPPAATLPIRIRPGPLSFKLQKAMQCLKSVETTNMAISHMSTSDILQDILRTGQHNPKNEVSNETSSCEALQVTVPPEKINSVSTQSAGTQTPKIVPRELSTPLEKEKGELVEPKRRSAEVILIESDDEVEIISIKSKQNVLTSMDGRKIEIHTMSQVISEEKVVEDVKIEYEQTRLLKLTPNQSQNIPATDGLISPKISSSISNRQSPILTAMMKPKYDSLSVPESPVTGSKNVFENMGVSNLVGTNVDQNSVMNLKITNVTSVPIEDFADSDLPMKPDQQVQIIEAPDLNNCSLNSRTMSFQLSSAAIKDINAKRKSKEYNCAVSNLTDTDIVEQRKRARISASKNLVPMQTSTTYTWSYYLNDVNKGIPIIAKSISTTQTSNSNRFDQSTAMMQRKPNESLISCNNGVKTVYGLEIRKKNGFHKYPSTTSVANSVQSQVNNNTNHIILPSNKPSTIGSQENSLYLSKSSPIQPQIKQIPATSMVASNLNVRGSTHSNQTFLVGTPSNLTDNLLSLNTSQGLTQPVSCIIKGAALSGGIVRINQSPKDKSRELQTDNDKAGQTIQTNLGEVVIYNGLAKSNAENPTSDSGNQPIASNVLKTGPSMTQLPNEITIPSGCDGDAGSSPAAEAGPAHQATSTSQLHVPPESISISDAASGPQQGVGAKSSVSTLVSAIPAKYVQRYSSFKATGTHCDKPGLIPENVPLQDLQFRVVDSEIIEIIVRDNCSLNINPNMGNPENKYKALGSRCSKKKENLVPSFTQEKFGAIKNDHNVNLPKDHGSPKSSKTTVPPQDSRSQKESLNPIISNTATSSIDGKTISSRLSETKCSIESKVSKTNLARKLFPSTKSLASVCAEDRDRVPLCAQDTENLIEEQAISSAFSSNGWSSKHVHNKDNRIFSNGECKYLSDNMIESSVKANETNNTAVDFCSKLNENKRSNGLTEVSECLVRNLLDFSEKNLPIDCYSNYKQIDDRSELNSNIKDFDAGVSDSLKKNGAKDDNLRVKNGFSKVLADPGIPESKKVAMLNLNHCKVQAVDEDRSLSSTEVNRKSINDGVGVRDEIRFRVDKNGPGGGSNKGELTRSGIKVKINLNKIQRFLDSKPELFYKSNRIDNKSTHEDVSETSPYFSNIRSFYANSTKKRSNYSSSETSRSEQKNTENSNARKRFKSDSGFFKEHTES